MQTVLHSDCSPLVSIIVPITDDVQEGATRLDLAGAQTWHKLEVIPVQVHGSSGIAQAINAGLAACTGEFISMMLPGASYTQDKIAKQVAFVEQFDLHDAAVFCDYKLIDRGHSEGMLIALPSFDPAVMFCKIYCGLPIDCSTLLVSRKAWAKVGLLDEHGGHSALQGFLLALSQHTDLVGMAAPLVSITGRKSLTGGEKYYLRNLYAGLLPEIVQSSDCVVYEDNLFAALGEATVARLGQGLLLAAWDNLWTTGALLSRSENTGQALRSFIKPLLRSALHRLPARVKCLLRSRLQNKNDAAASRLDFSAIYRDNGFVGTESLSGAGSTRFQTRVIRQKLPELVRELDVRSLVDIPCGDFHWMRDVDLADIHYTGADVVDEMVVKNQQLFGSPLRAFKCINLITGPLPAADLVFCRDCLVHLPFEDVLAAIETIRQSKCKWLLTTTFTRTSPNIDLGNEGWRALNLTLAPFNFPPPLRLIVEKCTEAGGLAGDKSLGLWRIADLPPQKITPA